MSLHYILDGYNIIHQYDAFASGSLEEQRKKLIRHLTANRPQGSVKNSVTIVFDGRADVFGDYEPSEVKVVFSKEESADEKIKRIVANSSNKANITVVTNDRDIQYNVRSQGAKTLSVQTFFSKPGEEPKESQTQKKSSGKDNKNISKTLEFKITSEFEKIWLKSKDKN